MLATHLVTLKTAKQEDDRSETRGGGYYIATGSGSGTGVHGYTVPVICGTYETAPTIETANGEVEVASGLDEARGKTLLYTLTNKVTPRDVE